METSRMRRDAAEISVKLSLPPVAVWLSRATVYL
jgi:uncharacterized membrane protein YqaE (UPF0057 family)